MRIPEIPGEQALCGDDQKLPADLYERLYLPGQDHVSGKQPQPEGFPQSGGRVSGRCAASALPGEGGDLPPGGLALRAGQPGGRAFLQRRGVQRDEGDVRVAGHADRQRLEPGPLPGQLLPVPVRRGPCLHPGAHLRGVQGAVPGILSPVRRMVPLGRGDGDRAGAGEDRAGAVRLWTPAKGSSHPLPEPGTPRGGTYSL